MNSPWRSARQLYEQLHIRKGFRKVNYFCLRGWWKRKERLVVLGIFFFLCFCSFNLILFIYFLILTEWLLVHSFRGCYHFSIWSCLNSMHEHTIPCSLFSVTSMTDQTRQDPPALYITLFLGSLSSPSVLHRHVLFYCLPLEGPFCRL